MKFIKKTAFIFILFTVFFCTKAFATGDLTAASTDQDEEFSFSELTTSHVPKDAIDALADGDINEAIVILREAPSNAKSLHLLRQATRISLFNDGKVKKDDAHRVYQNVAIAYHNLYLFLHAQGEENEEFFKKALKYYKKSEGGATALHQEENKILISALLAEKGDAEEAAKLFSEVDLELVTSYFEMAEYVSAYYAATNDVDNTLSILRKIYDQRPGALLTWILVGDDFYKLWHSEKFRNQVAAWRRDNSAWAMKLRLPMPSKPQLALPYNMDFTPRAKATPKFLSKQLKLAAQANTSKKSKHVAVSKKSKKKKVAVKKGAKKGAKKSAKKVVKGKQASKKKAAAKVQKRVKR